MKKKERIVTGRRNYALKPENTWGDHVQNIKFQKTNVEFTPSNPVEPVTKHFMSRKESMYDPISCKFNDKEIEKRLVREEGLDVAKRLEDGKATLNERVSTHNVINHEPRLKLSEEKMKKLSKGSAHMHNGIPDSQTPWNILNNKDFAPGTKKLNAYQLKHQIHRNSARKIPGGQAHDYSIISNKYNEGDEAKQASDKAARLQLAAAKYWQHNDQDPVAGTYYSEDKENEYQQACDMNATVAGLSQLNGQPASYKQREGHAYNLITNEVNELNPLLQPSSRDCQERTLKMQGRFLKNPQRTKAEADWKQRSFVEENRAESRVMKRSELHPSVELSGNRYDLLTAQDRKRIEARYTGTLLQQGQAGHRSVRQNDAWARMSGGPPGGGSGGMQSSRMQYSQRGGGTQRGLTQRGGGYNDSFATASARTGRASSRLSIFGD
jgi:hypothetical protein